MIPLKSAEQIYEYCKSNNLGSGTTKGWAIKHFQLLLDNLSSGEEIYCVFIGMHNYISMTKHDGNYAYAVTNKRIIMAQHKMFGTNVQSINLDNINDITLSRSGVKGIGIGTVCIDTYKEKFNVGVNTSYAQNVYTKVHDALDEIKGSFFNRSADVSNPVSTTVHVEKSPAEQIKEFKELLDLGIITQDEFEKKKKQLLGL